MTTPVTQVEKNGSMTMQFYLPSKFNSDTVPKPSSTDVSIVNIEEEPNQGGKVPD